MVTKDNLMARKAKENSETMGISWWFYKDSPANRMACFNTDILVSIETRHSI